MKKKMFLVKRCSMCFLSVLIFTFSGCSSKEAVRQDDTQLETQPIPPIVISEYILGFGDEVEISLYRQQEMTRKVRILPDGKIHYPLVGEINAQGLSVNQLRNKLREGLLKYYVDPQVSVSVTSLGSQKVFVLGEVKRPGVFQLDRPKTVVEAISEAEGFTRDAKLSYVLLIRGDPLTPNPNYKVVDMEKVLKQMDLTQNVSLQQGDIIYVPATEYANVENFFDRLWSIIPLRITYSLGRLK